MNRREFVLGSLAGAVGTSGLRLGGAARADVAAPALPGAKPAYDGLNVVIVRFGGGVRRQETIAEDGAYSPFLKTVLAPRGVLFPKMEIAPWVNLGKGKPQEELQTSHGEGTLNILTGKYGLYKDVDDRFLGARFEPEVPTLFEGLRKSFDLPPHQALIVNGEDRLDEEFYTFSNHLGFGINYRATVLSLYRYKVSVLRDDLASGKFKPGAAEYAEKLKALRKLEDQDRLNQFRTVVDEDGALAFRPERLEDDPSTTPELRRFWSAWADYYGRTGLVNPRGDRLLTTLSTWAMRRLQPRLMMVNYNDPDYVHWGNPSFYTRGVSIVDEGLRQLWEFAQADPFYRDRTVFVVVPDCGRDSNPFMAVPYQHHFNSRSAREIFCLAVGPGIDANRVVDRAVGQDRVAATVAAAMGFPMELAEGETLAEVFA